MHFPPFLSPFNQSIFKRTIIRQTCLNFLETLNFSRFKIILTATISNGGVGPQTMKQLTKNEENNKSCYNFIG